MDDVLSDVELLVLLVDVLELVDEVEVVKLTVVLVLVDDVLVD